MSRWLHAVNQRLLGIIFILFFGVFFLGPPFFPDVYWVITLIVLVCLASNAIRLALGLVITGIQVRRYLAIDWAAKCQQPQEHDKRLQKLLKKKSKAQVVAADAAAPSSADVPPGSTAIPLTETTAEEAAAKADQDAIAQVLMKVDQVHHLIIIPNYKEEFETLSETLDTLANHDTAKGMYKVILAMEEGEKGCEEKAEKLIGMFGQRFFQMRYTVHPGGIPGEARGKSSNVAWAASYYAKNWLPADEERFELITVMDADTHLSQTYFECITFKYLVATEEERTRLLFAPTLIFDRNTNEVPFVVRLADMAWSIGLIGNFQMPVKFPCSVYTVSMLLAKRVGFWDAGPEAIGEDMHMALKCLTATQMKLKLSPIYIPASCSNVQGDTYWQSIVARYQQSKRHLWGSLDFGYVCSRLITHRCWQSNPFKAILCIYFLFEIFFQPYFGFYQLSGQLIYPASATSELAKINLVYGTYVRYALLLPAVVVGLAYEYYHHLACTFRAGILTKVRERREAEAVQAKAEAAVDVEIVVSESSATPEQVAIAVETGDDAVVVSTTEQPEKYGETTVGFRKWYQVADWLGLPFCLVFFYMIPGVYAMLGQMFTKKMDYKVSLKPTTRATAASAVVPPAEEIPMSDEEGAGAVSSPAGIALEEVDNKQKLESPSPAPTSIDIKTPTSEESPVKQVLLPAAVAELHKKAPMLQHCARDSGVDFDLSEEPEDAKKVTAVEVTTSTV